MIHRLLVSGERKSFTTLSFDDENGELRKLVDFPAPYNASWVELSSSQGDRQCLIGLSEGEESGFLYTFEIDHERLKCTLTSQQATLGAPAHFITLQDQSAIALSTYLGGSVALYPVQCSDRGRLVLKDTERAEILFEFTYDTNGPIKHRQRQCHAHQVLEDKRGLLYVPDLGADRIWILRRENLSLDVGGWMQCPSGTGPRHAVFGYNDTVVYVIGELSHQVLAFDISTTPAKDLRPMESFVANVIPPSVDLTYTSNMDSAEICYHPSIPNVLYVSNRWERHIHYLENEHKDKPIGDAIAIILISDNGTHVKGIKHVRTGLDGIRGLRVSPDGRFVVAAGQEGGGIEIYKIGGTARDDWHLLSHLSEGLEGGIKHAIWL